MAQPSMLMVYFALILLAILLTVGFFIIMELHKPTKYAYIGFKVFFIIIFTLWMHKYLYQKFTKMIGIKDDGAKDDDDDNDDSFNMNILENIFE